MDFAYTWSPFALILFLFVGMLVCAELGFYLGRWAIRRGGEGETPLFNVVEGGVLGLVGLILAFSFSLAVARFDNRQHLVVTEAGDIRTTYLRSDFLPPAQRPAFRADLKDYTNTRLALYEGFSNGRDRAQILEKDQRLTDRLWRRVAGADYAAPMNRALGLLVESLNATFEDSEEQEAALSNRVPGEVAFLLLFVSAVAAALLGYGFGIHGSERRIMTVIFCLLITMLVYTIFDLDRPQSGFIRVNLQPLRSVVSLMI